MKGNFIATLIGFTIFFSMLTLTSVPWRKALVMSLVFSLVVGIVDYFRKTNK